MAYPPNYYRRTNFTLARQNGHEAPDATALDTELNALQTTVDGILGIIKKIVTANHQLVPGAAQKTALALVGSWSGTRLDPTTIQTDIDWYPFILPNTVLVVDDGKPLPPSVIVGAVAHGGKLRITTSTALSTGTISVWAFAPQTGLENRLLSDADGDGASRVAIHDEHGHFASTNVEDALAELAVGLQQFIAAVGDLSRYFFRDGSRSATGPFNMAGHKITNLANGTNPQDAVTYAQLQAATAATQFDFSGYLLLNGTRAMTGQLQMGGHRIVNVGDPVADYDAVNRRTLHNYVQQSLVTSVLAVPIGTLIPVCGLLPVDISGSGKPWLLCDGAEYNRLDYPVLYDMLPASMKGPHTFRVPDFRGRLPIGAGRLAKTPGGTDYYTVGSDGFDSRNHNVGEYKGEEYHRLTVSEMPSHSHAPPEANRYFVCHDTWLTSGGPGDSTWAKVYHYSSTGSAGNDQPHENLPPVFVVNYYIKGKNQ